MTNSFSPDLPNSFILFPMGCSAYAVDFWSCLYAISTEMEAEAIFLAFPKCTSTFMADLGYDGTKDATPTLVSLSKGIIGLGRKMLVYRNHRAGALLYFKVIEDLYYVSLRVVYFQPFSLLKILRFALISLAMTLFSIVVNSLTIMTTWYGDTHYSFDPNPSTLMEGMMVGMFLSAFIFVVWGMWSWWWTGRFLNFLREDFDELYRDDLASIGHAAYNAIIDAADTLSLKALNPQEQPVPTFGLGQVANPTRRQRRI